VRGTLGVDMDLGNIMPGTAARKAFEENFKQDVARVLGGGVRRALCAVRCAVRVARDAPIR
jgi:hypothetical protein